MGQDLTALGLNLNSMENLYQSFGGPFSESSARPQDIEYPVPSEYLINISIRDKLAQMKMKQYKDDLLFFLFYTNCGDVMQLAAATELYEILKSLFSILISLFIKGIIVIGDIILKKRFG